MVDHSVATGDSELILLVTQFEIPIVYVLVNNTKNFIILSSSGNKFELESGSKLKPNETLLKWGDTASSNHNY